MAVCRPYPSDLSDARWALIEPTLTAWRRASLDTRSVKTSRNAGKRGFHVLKR